MPHAQRGKLAGMFARLARLDGGHVDEQRALGHGIGHAQLEQHFAHDGAALQQAHGKVHAAHGICRAVVDAHAIGSQRLGLGAGAVPDVDLMAGLGQAAGHGQAHHARAQNGDLQCVHGVVSLELL
jgi:N-formylglutamate amidohydrolase